MCRLRGVFLTTEQVVRAWDQWDHEALQVGTFGTSCTMGVFEVICHVDDKPVLTWNIAHTPKNGEGVGPIVEVLPALSPTPYTTELTSEQDVTKHNYTLPP